MKYKELNLGVCAPKGFFANGVHAGIRKNKNKLDLGLIYSNVPCTTVAVYTSNKVKGDPLLVTKEHLTDNKAMAIIVNSGNANTCNIDGIEKANLMCEYTANTLNIKKEDVIVASTGVIGQVLDVTGIKSSMQTLVDGLNTEGSPKFAEAIMTTDTIKKEVSIEFKIGDNICHIGAVAKGSGMINPNMATLLAFVTTDVNIDDGVLKYLIKDISDKTLNMINIDGDTSTNDMFVIMSSKLAENEEIKKIDDKYEIVKQAFLYVMKKISKMLAKDGEGATKMLECVCVNAPSEIASKAIALNVISSSLLKAAMFASDANWGRVLCAIGNAQSDFDVDKMQVSFESKAGNICVCNKGKGVDFNEDIAKKILSEDEITIHVDLKQGDYSATAWGCDLTYDYIKINAEYRT